MKKRAFTLLEILIVVGIIALLVGLISFSYSSAQKKARDSRRKSDLKAVQSALEQYYSVCSYTYPQTLSGGVICAAVDPTVAIMPTIPVDPKTGVAYAITPGAGTSYTICTTLESESPTSYCVSNQQ